MVDKRFILQAALVLTAVMPAAARQIKVNRQIEYIPVEDVRLAAGPFRDAQEKGVEYLLAIDPDRLLAPYLKEAGLTPKAANYTNWENTGLDGHIGGHYVSALAYMYAATGNEEIGRRLDYMLKELKRCQDAAGDGYLCGVPGGRAMWKDVAEGRIKAGGFDLNGKWVPLYNIHKTFAGLKDAWTQTHREDARDMLVRLTDWMAGIVGGLTDAQVQDMLRSEHGGLNEIFADVAVITGEDKYLDLARRFSHREILDPLVKGENRLTGKHANTQIPKVIGYKRIADIERNADWARGVDFFWDDVANHRSVSIGGNSVREHFHSPDDFSPMLESEQGPETCNTYNMLRLAKMLEEAKPDGEYTDYAERALFNHILSSQNPEKGGFVYFTPMRSGHYRVYSQPQTSFWCCVGSGMENQARYGEYIYATDGKGLYANLFIPSSVEWNGATIEQQTDFPASETTVFTVTPGKKKDFALNVRIPGWTDAGKVRLTLNGKEVAHTVDGGYARVARKWKKGDRLEVTLPMSLHLEQLADRSPNYSILYGPVVLASSLGTEGQDGLFADDSRGGHIAHGRKLPLQDMPVIVGEADSILSYITKEDDKPLAFRLSHVYPAKYDGMELVPFSSLRECRYMVYWPVISEGELAERQKALAEKQAARMALDAITADLVVCGEQQPESDHFITEKGTRAGADEDVHWRQADKGGRFGYTMRKGDKGANRLRVYYRPGKGETADVLIGGQSVGQLAEGDPKEVVFAEFPLPDSGDGTYAVTVQAGDSRTPRVYELRLVSGK